METAVPTAGSSVKTFMLESLADFPLLDTIFELLCEYYLFWYIRDSHLTVPIPL